MTPRNLYPKRSQVNDHRSIPNSQKRVQRNRQLKVALARKRKQAYLLIQVMRISNSLLMFLMVVNVRKKSNKCKIAIVKVLETNLLVMWKSHLMIRFCASSNSSIQIFLRMTEKIALMMKIVRF